VYGRLRGCGLTVPDLSEQTKSRLRKFLPSAAGYSNPIDMVASARADSYQRTIETLLPSPEIDALIVIYIPIDHNDSEAITESHSNGRKPGSSWREAKTSRAGMPDDKYWVAPTDHQTKRTIRPTGSRSPSARVLSKTVAYTAWQSKPLAVVPGFPDIQKDNARRVVVQAIEARGEGWLLRRRKPRCSLRLWDTAGSECPRACSS
jgi:hypothetical protein